MTLEQVAQATGFARTTISDILNRSITGRYSEATRRRVNQAMVDLGYAPVRAAQQLARGNSGQIGLMLTRDFLNPFFARVADIAERELRIHRYRLQLALTDGNPETERQRIHQMQSDAVEGLLVGPVYEWLDLDQHRAILRGRLPIMLFGGPVDSEFDLMAIDHEAGWALAAEHLYAMGHRRVGFLCCPPKRGLDPGALIARRLRAAGVRPEEWIVVQPDTGRFEDFHVVSLSFAKRWKATRPGDRPTAMLCLNDQVAMTALSALASVGVGVPDDVSLIGCDNLPESAYLVPALSTIDNHVNDLMIAAVRRLIERIRKPALPRLTQLIRPTLVERQTVARVRPESH